MSSVKHLIVFGYGPYGEEIAKSLRAIYKSVMIVDQYKRHLEKAQEDGFSNFMQINVHDEQAFETLGINENSVAFCAFEDEGFNTYLALSLRSTFENLSIIAIGQTKESTHKLTMAGANKVIIMEETSANIVYNALIHPHVSALFNEILYEKNDLVVAEITVSDSSLLDGVYLKDIAFQVNHNVIVLGVVDLELSNKFILASSQRDHKLDTGDALVVIGPKDKVAEVQALYSISDA